jgi:hypothetical protein
MYCRRKQSGGVSTCRSRVRDVAQGASAPGRGVDGREVHHGDTESTEKKDLGRKVAPKHLVFSVTSVPPW